MTPEFKREGAKEFSPFDTLFSGEHYHKSYDLIIQTQNHAWITESHYLHDNPEMGVCFGVLSRIRQGERNYSEAVPVWFGFIHRNKIHSAFEGRIELIFRRTNSARF